MNRYITPVIFLILAVAIYVTYIDPTYAAIQKGLARERELQSYIADAKTAQDRLNKIKYQYEHFPSGSDQALHVILPDTMDPTRLIIDINAVVERHGLVMKGPGVAIGTAEKGGHLAAHKVSFAVSAPYTVFRELLRDLEASLALRDMSSVSLSVAGLGETGTGGNSAFSVHDYGLTLTTYSYAQ